jgi:hypothetical protein
MFNNWRFYTNCTRHVVRKKAQKSITIQRPTDTDTAHVKCKGENDTDDYWCSVQLEAYPHRYRSM